MLGASLSPLQKGLGAVGLALGYAGFRGMEFDSAMSQVQAATMATAGDMDRLRDAAIEQGAKTKYSSEEAAQGITEMAKAGVSTADIMGGGLAGALNLAAAGELDVGTAAEIAATQLTVFGLRGDQVNHVADLLAAGAGKAQGSVMDMALALNYAGLPAKGLGLSIEETTGAIGLFASQGLVGEKAGTAFRGVLVSMANPAAKTRELMDELNLSFFDTRGEFIGMDGVAGQLQSRLGGLTVETRNQALAQIFGNEGLAAAQALYTGGAAGVQQWARNVDDAGYAARQAAINQDNLRGDLEKLGGAFDSVMTTIGGGVQGPLRDLTQALTWVVETGGDVVGFVQSLPGPLQAAAAAIAVLLIANGPAAGALARTGDALSGLAARASGAVTSLAGLKGAGAGLVGALGGPVGIAIGASTVSIGYMIKGLVTMGEATVDTAGYQEQLATALQQSTGAIDENVRALAAKQAAEVEISSDTSLLDYASRAGVELNLVTDALLGNKAAAAAVAEQLDAYVEAHSLAAIARGEDAGTIAGWTEANNKAKDAIGQLVPVLGDAQTKNAQLAEATAESGAAMGESTTAVRDFGAEASEANSAVDALKAGLDALTGTTVTMHEAEMQLGAAIASATGALENKHGAVLNADGSLNAYSESGRAASDVLLDIRNSGNQLISTLIQQGATEDEVRAADARLRQSFIDTAVKMGASEMAALDLANQILGIPAERETRILADTGPAERAIAEFTGKIMRSGNTTVAVSGFGLQGGTRLNNADGNLVQFYRDGGLRPMAADVATVVPPNTWRVVGDRPVGDEAFIPINKSARSEKVLAETAARMGYELAPATVYNAFGGVYDSYTVPISLDHAGSSGFLNAIRESLTAGTAGSDPIAGSGWQPIWNYVKARVPLARINSTYRAGDPGRHGRGLAVDFGYGSGPGGAGSAGLALINRVLHDGMGRNLAELIYTGIGDDRPDLRMGRPHRYSAAVNRGHTNHVHAAREHGGPVWAGQNVLVGEGGPEIVHMTGPGTVIPADRTATMLAPASMPGYGAAGGGPVTAVIDYKKLADALGPRSLIGGNVTFPPSDRRVAHEAISELWHRLRVLDNGGRYTGVGA
ncbi:phage tail tape measure protein [Blastococcus colisei]|nr:phage tail tape measure protein [Blastococcus colisei]